MIITKAEERRKILKEQVNPSRVAVAFVGRNWRSYIDKACLKEIVLWPTIGTNPYAVEELIHEIGIKNVHFLDYFHSKIYIGDHAAMLGSCNLSDNGFRDDGHEEAAVVLTEAAYIEQLNSIFNYYKKMAKKSYSDAEKQPRLEKLKAEWKSTASASRRSGVDIDQFDVGQLIQNSRHKIHLAWYFNTGVLPKLDADRIRQSSNLHIEQSVEDYFYDYGYFHEDDDIRTGDWILMYGCNDYGKPGKRSGVDWLYVSEVHPSVVEDDKYTKLVGQVEFEPFPLPPFKLDSKLKSIIRETVPSYKAILPPNNEKDVWRIDEADKCVSDFIREIMKRYSESK